MRTLIYLAVLLVAGTAGVAGAAPLPNPYSAPERQWAHLPDGRPWGSSAGIDIGPHGELWAIDRCAANSCDGSSLPAVYQLDPRTGKPVRSLGFCQRIIELTGRGEGFSQSEAPVGTCGVGLERPLIEASRRVVMFAGEFEFCRIDECRRRRIPVGRLLIDEMFEARLGRFDRCRVVHLF